MSYRPGSAGLAEGLALVFMLTVPRVFLTALTAVLEQGAQFGWVAVLLGGVFSLVMFFVLFYVSARVPGDLLDICQRVLGRPAARLIAVFYMLLFWGNAVLLFREYTENTLITALPFFNFQLVVAYYTLAVGALMYLGFGAIIRTSYVFLPYLLMGMAGVSLLLIPYYNFYHLLPWLGNGPAAAAKLSVTAAGYNFGVLAIIILAPTFQAARTVRAAAVYGLALSVGIKVLYMIVYVLVFNTSVGTEKTMPFFEMARLVYLSRYLQHVEAPLILLWAVIGMLAIAASLYVALYLFARLLDLPALRPLAPLATLLTASLSMLFMAVPDVVRLDSLFNYAANFGLYVIPAVILAAAFRRGREKSWRAL